MKVVYDNEFENNTMTVTTENANFPKENLVDSRRSTVYKTTSATDQRIEISGSNITANYLFIFSHNLTGNSVIRVQATNNLTWTAPELDLLIDPSVYTITKELTFGASISWLGTLYGQSLYGQDLYGATITEDGFTFDNWSVLISDATLSVIEIGLLVLGSSVDFPEMSPDQNLEEGTASRFTYSESGQIYGDMKYNYDNPTIKFPFVTREERSAILDLWDEVKNVKPFVVMIWPEDLDLQDSMFCKIDQKKISFKKNPGNLNNKFNTQIKFREVF